LKITELETIPLRLPFAQPFKISQGAGRETVETLIVRVHTDEGIVGIGETQAWRRQGSAEVLWNLVRIVKDHFEPLIAGRSPFDVAGILATLNEALYNTFYAQAAVADALYDIAGKGVGLPVHKLLGGECRDRVRIAGLLAMKPTVAETLERAGQLETIGGRTYLSSLANQTPTAVHACVTARSTAPPPPYRSWAALIVAARAMENVELLGKRKTKAR